MSNKDRPAQGSDVEIALSKTEKDRGSRKEGKKGVVPDPPDTSSDEPDNSETKYGGMDGGDYPPSNFPFAQIEDPKKTPRK